MGDEEREEMGREIWVGKLVLVTEMMRPRVCVRVESDQTGLSRPREETVTILSSPDDTCSR